MTLLEEFRDLMDQFQIDFYGFSNIRGSKVPTCYSSDPKMESLIGKELKTYKHRVCISPYYINNIRIKNKYYMSFQPLHQKIYKNDGI